jgi:hypothetical protein
VTELKISVKINETARYIVWYCICFLSYCIHNIHFVGYV